jgi:hypothetical protein
MRPPLDPFPKRPSQLPLHSPSIQSSEGPASHPAQLPSPHSADHTMPARDPNSDETCAPGLPTAFRWALDANADPGRAAADWLAREIVPGAHDASAAVASTLSTLEQLVALKTAFKALRTGAATSGERNRAARLYAAAIAAGLVRFGVRISRQSDTALRKAFIALHEDATCEEPLRDLATVALSRVPKP